MSALAFESRLPVGSSAKMISGAARGAATATLLLTAGELRGRCESAVAQAHRVDHAVEPLLVGSRPRAIGSVVLDRGERRDRRQTPVKYDRPILSRRPS
jgi:hypothetical protein